MSVHVHVFVYTYVYAYFHSIAYAVYMQLHWCRLESCCRYFQKFCQKTISVFWGYLAWDLEKYFICKRPFKNSLPVFVSGSFSFVLSLLPEPGCVSMTLSFSVPLLSYTGSLLPCLCLHCVVWASLSRLALVVSLLPIHLWRHLRGRIKRIHKQLQQWGVLMKISRGHGGFY